MSRMRSEKEGDSPERETVLFDRVVEGDKAALAELYCLYHPRLFRFAFRLTNSYGAAEELVNDVMLAVWNGASDFANRAKISTWIFSIAYRQCMSYMRGKRIAMATDVSVEDIADEAAASLEDREWVQRALERLPDEQRLCIVLVFYLGCSYTEIAAITDCKEATVKTRMFHARKKLRVFMPELAVPNMAVPNIEGAEE